MTPILYSDFNQITGHIQESFRVAPYVHTQRWQSIDISDKPHMIMREMLHQSFRLILPSEALAFYRQAIVPNLPWADRHFEQERVGGEPLNPGTTYLEWSPGAMVNGQNSSGSHLHDGKFDHTYAERYWPKFAGVTPGGRLDGETERRVLVNGRHGIRFAYGDLNTLVDLLSGEPLTRQAYLPVWFPEDLTAAMEPKRVPCSLGYHFIMRNGWLDVTYSIRSCDYIRHFRDDVYMTIRLLLWVLSECRLSHPELDWDRVKPGHLIMHITSLHMFQADWKRLYKGDTP